MTNVSKKKLNPKHEQQLLRQFSNLFANSSSKQIQQLFEEILTPAEKIMLVKRVAIVLMLAEDFSTYKISKTLKVSDATVRSVRRTYKDKEFDFVFKATQAPSFDREKFWQTLDVLLRLGMPPMGRGRWQFLDK